MRKAFLVAKHEYLNKVRKRSFLLATLGIPLLIIGVAVVAVLIVTRGGSDAPVGARRRQPHGSVRCRRDGERRPVGPTDL